MAKPSDKSGAFETFLERYAEEAYGRSRTESIRKNICLGCGEAVGEFRDSLSKKEYAISGFCQVCQDKVFGKD